MKKYIQSLRFVALMALSILCFQFSTIQAQDSLYIYQGGTVLFKRALLQIDSMNYTAPAYFAAVTTTAASSITATTASSGGNITNDGGAAITARGVCWSTSSNPTVALATKTSDGSGTGLFSSTITGLTPVTTYYVRAYATNSAGTAYGPEISFSTTEAATASACGAYLGAGNTNYKQFLCRNLGAAGNLYSKTGALSYVEADNGDLYQWGRPTDGHEKQNSATISTLATSNTPEHNKFIINSSEWRSGGGETTRWTDATKAANDPCPTGYKVPSQAQWAAVLANNTIGSWASGNSFGPNLFLPGSGYREWGNGGAMSAIGWWGLYWSSTATGTNNAYALSLSVVSGAIVSNYARAYGFRVRCIAE